METPTAEEHQKNNFDGLRDALQDDDLYYFYKGVISQYAISFTKLHLKKQAKEIADKTKIKIWSEGFTEVDKASIFESADNYINTLK